MRVLQLSGQDAGGGAERAALDMHRAFLQAGADARLLVRYRRSAEPGVVEVDASRAGGLWGHLVGRVDRELGRRHHFRGRDRVRERLADLARPGRVVDRGLGSQGRSGFVAEVLRDPKGWQPDVINAHNLHGDHFALGAIPELAAQSVLVWTLHDAWALTGHCAYPIECPRWRNGCGSCPDLGRAPAVRRDRTAENWKLKREVYERSRLHVVTPSRWLMSQVEHSMLRPTTAHVIPYGIDLDTFRPGSREAARERLGLSPTATLLLFVAASGAAVNTYKDYATVAEAVERVLSMRGGYETRLVCLGGSPGREEASSATTTFVGRVFDPRLVALYYHAADVFLHAARADNLPLTVLEAQASGLPVVATAVGGISEEVIDGETGYLVPAGDGLAMAESAMRLVKDREQRRTMGVRAAERVAALYDRRRRTDEYLNLYADLLARREAPCGSP